MTHDGDIPFHQQLRRARIAAGLTQSALAAQVGCRQSAVSMMEAGRREAMARETLERVAALLKVDLPEASASAAPAPARLDGGTCVSVCGNFNCPSNVPYGVGDAVHFLPLGNAGQGRHCVFCGELLMRVCPACGAPIATPGGCCGACGRALVEWPDGYVEDVSAWITGRVEAIESLRRLLR